jgi:hypothetical protein
VCWTPLWNSARAGVGLEHLLLGEGEADSVVLAIDEEHGAFRLTYRLRWDEAWRLSDAELCVATARATQSLALRSDGRGQWSDGGGRTIDELAGCLDIDIWPTPFTNTFPLRRAPLALGERGLFRMAWISALELVPRAQAQAYTRLGDRLYLFESLDGSAFRAELLVDEDSLVIDYPGLFQHATADARR